MKLSEDIEWCMAGQALNPITASRWMTEARALEERVAELEGQVDHIAGLRDNWKSKCHAEAKSANQHYARAEAAEAEVARQIKLAMGYADERDALREEVARLREANAVTRERALQSEEIALTAIDEGDALRAKLEKVRAAVRVPTCSSYEKSYDAAYAALTLVESILDGEGDNEA